jgi:hypothetical protein
VRVARVPGVAVAVHDHKLQISREILSCWSVSRCQARNLRVFGNGTGNGLGNGNGHGDGSTRAGWIRTSRRVRAWRSSCVQARNPAAEERKVRYESECAVLVRTAIIRIGRD